MLVLTNCNARTSTCPHHTLQDRGLNLKDFHVDFPGGMIVELAATEYRPGAPVLPMTLGDTTANVHTHTHTHTHL